MDTYTTSPDQLQKQIAAARRHVAQLEQAATKLASPQAETDPEVFWLDGGEAIAAFLRWPVKRVYATYRAGRFGTAVWKTGWRTMLGSRSRLRALPELLSHKP
jgi:hypothetical protein